MKSRLPVIFCFCLLSLSCVQPPKASNDASSDAAQANQQPAQRKDIYADPKNLKVLTADISSAELGETMKGFAMGLGVRCETCHVGEAGQPLTSFDFAADDKPMKAKARVMMEMLDQINTQHISQLDAIEAQQRVSVRCVTCHRGQPKPALIEDVLDQELASDGVPAAVEKYQALREEFYGSHSYDFSEFALPMYAANLARAGQLDAAIALSDVNAEYFPGSYYTQFTLGELHRKAGSNEAAVVHYEKAIELNSRAAPMLKPMLEKLQAN